MPARNQIEYQKSELMEKLVEDLKNSNYGDLEVQLKNTKEIKEECQQK